MAELLDDLPARTALVRVAQDFHQRGWMAGTAGNLSVRDADAPGTFWITASGCPKGRLDERDFVRVAVADGAVCERGRPDAKPSAETAIHRVIYRRFPEARACFHIHSVDACLAVERTAAPAPVLPLPPLEMLKGLGVWEEAPQVSLSLFANWLDVGRIADDIAHRFQTSAPDVPVLMVREHGPTVWGAGLQQTYDRVEAAEFILRYLARKALNPAS